jgi:hypothetical protein
LGEAVCAARSAKAANKVYDLPGGEAITYREMIGRIFDGMGRRCVIFPVPPPLWLLAFGLLQRQFSGFRAEMGVRMASDLTFDPSAAHPSIGSRFRTGSESSPANPHVGD